MKYVLDASAAICWVIVRPHSAKARRLRAEYDQAIHELLAPSVFAAEIASAPTKSERQKLIPVGAARPLLAKILRTMPVLYPYGRLLRRATDISSRTRVALYDCLYVALAERESCQLVTVDQKAINSLAAHFPFILPLASLP